MDAEANGLVMLLVAFAFCFAVILLVLDGTLP